MKRTRSNKLKPGDLFKIPLEEEKYALGCVLQVGLELYVCIFNGIHGAQIDVSAAKGSNILMIGLTADGGFYRGDWSVVGHKEIDFEYPKPYSVVNTSDGLVLKEFTGQVVRKADERDAGYYGYRKSVSSASVKVAAMRFLGLQPESDEYAFLSVGDAIRRSLLI